MTSDELEELQYYFDKIEPSAELAQLNYWLHKIQALIRQRADRLKSEPDPVERVNREFLLKGWHILEQIALAKISRYYLDNEMAQLETDLASPAIDSAPPRVHPHQLFPNLDISPRRTVSRPLGRGEQLREQLEAVKTRLAAKEDEILQCENKFAELMKFLESNETSKKPAAESPPYVYQWIVPDEAVEYALAAGWYDSQANAQAPTTPTTVQSESREQRSVRRTEALMPLLQKKDWTPSRLATEAGVVKNSVTHYLNGRRKTITLKNRQAIADALEVKLEQIPKLLLFLQEHDIGLAENSTKA